MVWCQIIWSRFKMIEWIFNLAIHIYLMECSVGAQRKHINQAEMCPGILYIYMYMIYNIIIILYYP